MMEHGGMRSAWERSSPKTRSPARLHECPHAISCGRWLASWADRRELAKLGAHQAGGRVS